MNRSYCLRLYLAVCLVLLVLVSAASAQAPVLFDGTGPVVFSFEPAASADSIPRSQLITPEELSKSLQSAKPLLLGVGPHSLYAQAHIPGSEYMGAGSSDAGQQKLRERVKSLPKNSAIVSIADAARGTTAPTFSPRTRSCTPLVSAT